MRDHFAVTISDDYGSRYYTVKKSYRTLFFVTIGAVLLGLVFSSSANVLQFKHGQWLGKVNRALDDELLRFDSENSNLNLMVSKQQETIEKISAELVEIEKNSGTESADQEIGLVERLRLLAGFYNDKDEAYSVIGSRVQQIEGLIGLADDADDAESESKANLAARVELASLTASHERILHDSIPNGFPTESNIITSKFGKRIHPVTKIRSFHKGVDLRAGVGDGIRATADGIVREANFTELSGNRVVVQHNFGFETRYSHLEGFDVAPGDIVHKGDVIGKAGSTGVTDGPHLHYEIRYLGKSIDPDQFLKWEFGSHEIFTNVQGIKWPSLISLINKQLPQTLELSGL